VNPRIEDTAARTGEGLANSDVLDAICERVRLRAILRAAWFSGLHDGEPLSSPRPREEDERSFYRHHEALKPLHEQLETIEAELCDPAAHHALAHLLGVLGLGPAESDVLQLCVALEAEPSLAPLVGRLGSPWACESTARRLFGYSRAALLPAGASVWRWRLLERLDRMPGEEPVLRVDPLVREWLAGHSSIEPELQGILHGFTPVATQSAWAVEETASQALAALESGAPVRLRVVGPARSGRSSFAALVAGELGLRAVRVRASLVDAAQWPEILRRALRTCAVLSLTPIFDSAALTRPWPASITAPNLTAFTCEGDEALATPPNDAIELVYRVPELGLNERVELWRDALQDKNTWPEHYVDTIARYPLTIGEIRDLSRRGARAPQALEEACRELGRERLGDLGSVLPTPFVWDDLVLKPDLLRDLRELTFEARERAALWEEPSVRRLFPRGRGLTVLLTGSPGTGKTMAAQVLAADLGLDLYRVDLATLVSKYIGETSKNLRRVFTTAARAPAILLFDEADALFTRRTEVRDSHDRWANADTNYLLQLLESFPGIALLASNRRENIDSAFTRRFRYILDFPRPDPEQRKALWLRALAVFTEDATMPRELEHLASLDLTGAQIKNATLGAVFVARSERAPLSAAHLLRGLERELNKDGRYLSPRERERLAHIGA